MSTITLEGDYGYTGYRVKDLPPGTVFDAENATWIQDNDDSDGVSNPYPFQVYNTPGAVLDGGTILGETDMTSAWRTVYDRGNSAAVRVQDSLNAVFRDWRIIDTWDAIRISGDSAGFLIEDVWVSRTRDDAVENDDVVSGTIRDSLFDEVFSGISLGDSNMPDGSDNVVTLDGVLLRSASYLYKGEITHGSPIKIAKNDDLTPSLRIFNTVFAIEDVNHFGQERLQKAWEKTIESSGNYFLNLSDKPLPGDYPMPPSGWTVLQGQEARDYWQEAREEWIARHGGDGAPPVTDEDSAPPATDDGQIDVPNSPPPVVDEEQPDAGGDPSTGTDGQQPPPVDNATFDGTKYIGSNDDDLIIGNAGDNYIDGKNGDDTIKGGAGDDTIRGNEGADILWGGDGKDVFLYKRESDSREGRGVDVIMDFTKGDKIDLSRIDAARSYRGDQAFVLVDGEIKQGQLSVSYDAVSGYTVILGNVDNDSTAELKILLAGEVALSESDFIL